MRVIKMVVIMTIIDVEMIQDCSIMSQVYDRETQQQIILWTKVKLDQRVCVEQSRADTWPCPTCVVYTTAINRVCHRVFVSSNSGHCHRHDLPQVGHTEDEEVTRRRRILNLSSWWSSSWCRPLLTADQTISLIFSANFIHFFHQFHKFKLSQDLFSPIWTWRDSQCVIVQFEKENGCLTSWL